MSKGSTATQLATLLEARKPIRLYVNQKLAAGDFRNPKIEVMQTCLNKGQYLGVCYVGAFAVIEYHHGDADTVARIQHMVRSKSLRLPQDLTDAALGATSGVRYRTNIRVFANDHVHGSTTRHTLPAPEHIGPSRTSATSGIGHSGRLDGPRNACFPMSHPRPQGRGA